MPRQVSWARSRAPPLRISSAAIAMSNGVVNVLIDLTFLGAFIAFFVAWLLFRNVDEGDQAAWDGVALAETVELLDAHGQDAAQDLADLWQLDAERKQATRDE